MSQPICIYHGKIDDVFGPQVFASESRKLCLYLNHVRHSPDGFHWGYLGSGPAQLAYALCYHATRDRVLTQLHYQFFKSRVVVRLRPDEWWVSSSFIRRWLREDATAESLGAYLIATPSMAAVIGAWAENLSAVDYGALVDLYLLGVQLDIVGDWLEEYGGERDWVDDILVVRPGEWGELLSCPI